MTSDFTIDHKEFQSIKNSIKDQIDNDRDSLIKQVFTCVDNTTLSGSDSFNSVADFCRATVSMCREGLHPASVCIYPFFVAEAKKLLKDTGISVASVAGGFPAGQIPLALKNNEVRYIVENGADEVDFVINRGSFLSGDVSYVFDEVASAKEICGKSVLLKVILETGELLSAQNIYAAAMIVMEAGADFVKTSTGKIPVGATPESAYAILSAIFEFQKKESRPIGYKAAGGLSTIDEALFHYCMASRILGIENIDKHRFRIGTSRLTTQLFKNLTF